MANDTIASQILQLSFDTDPTSVKNTLAQVQNLRSGLNGLVADTKKLSTTTSGLTNDYGKLSAKAVEARNNLLKGTQAMKDQITVADRLAKVQRDTASAGGIGGSGTGGAASEVRLIGKGLKLANTIGNVIEPIPGLGQASIVLKQAAPLIEGLGASVGELAIAAPLAGVAVAGVAIAFKLAADEIEKGKERVEGALGAQEHYFQVVQTGTRESIQTELDGLKAKKEADQAAYETQVAAAQQQRDNIPILGALGVATSGLAQHIQDNKKAVQDDEYQINALTEALKNNKVAANEEAAARKALAGEFSTGPNLAQQIEGIQQKEQSALDQMAKARENEAQQEADILQRSADQKIAIAEKEAEAEAAALLSLQRANAEGQIKLSQAEADDRLNFQRGEAKAARDHADKLLQIRRDEQRDEVDLIANRDFAGLAKARRDLNNKLDDEQQSYADSKRERLIELKQKLQDDVTAFVREREQRQRAYQQQLSDLRTAEARDLAANAASARLEISRLQAKLSAQQKLEQAGYNAMLAQEAQFIKLRIDLLSGAISAAQAKIEGDIIAKSGGDTIKQGVLSGEGLKHLAGGGYLPGGMSALVNEGLGRESWTSGGRTMWLPNAKGYFTPTQGGHVNPAGGGAPQISISVRADTKRAILRETARQLSDALEGIA